MTIYSYNMKTKKRKILKQQEIIGKYTKIDIKDGKRSKFYFVSENVYFIDSFIFCLYVYIYFLMH